MSSHRTYVVAFMLILLSACAKKQFDPLPPQNQKPPASICDCDPGSAEYLRGVFNTTTVCFNTTKIANDTFSNAYYSDNSIHLDHINLIRENINHTMSCQIYLSNTNLHNKQLPYVLPHANPAYNENAEIVLSDLNKAWASNIDEDYVGNTYKGFNITIVDTSGGYLRGYFNGAANTRFGKKVVIEDGAFNIKVINVNKN